MLISISAPRKGMGQTVTAINLCAALKRIIGLNTVLVDLNKSYGDVECYLSSSKNSKGLDDFCSISNANLLSLETFSTCINRGCGGFDIMAANRCFELTDADMDKLINYLRKTYQAVVFDTVGGYDGKSNEIAKTADVEIVVLSQFIGVLNALAHNNGLNKPAKNTIYVVNRYMESVDGKKVNLRDENITSIIKNINPGAKVFFLEFDAELMNESNDGSLLNYAMNSRNKYKNYVIQLERIALEVAEVCGIKRRTEIRAERKIFSMFRPVVKSEYLKL